MLNEEMVSLDCPYCGAGIYESLNWFKKPYFTCPACRKGLAGGQFASLVSDIEAALDARIDDDVRGEQGPGCCRGKHAGRE